MDQNSSNHLTSVESEFVLMRIMPMLTIRADTPLVKQGFKGGSAPCHCRSVGHHAKGQHFIQQKETEWKTGRASVPDYLVEPLYTMADAEAALVLLPCPLRSKS